VGSRARSRCEDEARALYGRAYDAAAIARRYGAQIGYWSFYLKTGVARLRDREASISGHAGLASRPARSRAHGVAARGVPV
jgi:hypothetical protein